MPIDVGVDHRHPRLGQNADRRHHQLQLAAGFLNLQKGLALPSQVHVADPFLGEGDRRRPGTRIEHRHALVQLADELLRVIFRAAALQALPQAARKLNLPLPDVLGLGVTISRLSWTRSGQSLICFGFPLRTTNTIVEV